MEVKIQQGFCGDIISTLEMQAIPVEGDEIVIGDHAYTIQRVRYVLGKTYDSKVVMCNTNLCVRFVVLVVLTSYEVIEPYIL